MADDLKTQVIGCAHWLLSLSVVTMTPKVTTVLLRDEWDEKMDLLEKSDAPGLGETRQLTLDELASSDEAVRIVARLTRKNQEEAEGSEPVRVAAFNSFI